MSADSEKTSSGLASPAPCARRARELAQAYGQLVCQCVPAALVVASLVHLLQVLHLPLELPAVVLANQVAEVYQPEDEPLAIDERQWLAVAVINETHFRSAYQGVRPLDRCQLERDLKGLLDNDLLQVVAIDLDLSPTVATDDDSRKCQEGLEKLLKKHASKLILIRPLAIEDRAWPSDLKAPSLTFASPRFLAQLGVVWKWQWQYQETGTDSRGQVVDDMEALGDVLARRVCDLPSDKAASTYCENVRKRRDKISGDEASYISFREKRYLHGEGEPLALSHPCLISPPQVDCGVRAVIVGGTYGSREDEFTTPVGRLQGVSVHAVIAAQAEKKVPHLLEFGLEVALGAFLFGPLAHALWKHYFRQRVGHGNSRFWWGTSLVALLVLATIGAALLVPAAFLEWAVGLAAALFVPAAYLAWAVGLGALAVLALVLAMLQKVGVPKAGAVSDPHLAYRWLVLFTLLMVDITVLGLLAAVAGYAWGGFWLSPVPIAIGMGIEATVTSGVHTASHLLEEEESSNREHLRALVTLSSIAKSATHVVQPLSVDLRSATAKLVVAVAQLRDTPGAVVEDISAHQPDASEPTTHPTTVAKPNAALEARLQELAHRTERLAASAETLTDAADKARESTTELAQQLSSSIPHEASTSLPLTLNKERTCSQRAIKWATELPRLVGTALVVLALASVLFFH